MLGEKHLLEQQLQETAGELVEAERALSSRTIHHQASLQQAGPPLQAIVTEAPEVPPAVRPGSAPLVKGEGEGVVMPGGALVSFDSIRRDYGAMMQVAPSCMCVKKAERGGGGIGVC